MRSLAATIALAAIAALMVALTGVSLSDGSLDRLLGGRPVEEGGHLYQFDPAAVHRIRLTGPGVIASFQETKGFWRSTEPWNDRADPRHIAALINYTLQTTVEEAIPRDKVDARLVGLETGNIVVLLENSGGEPLAQYVLGRRTAWFAEDEDGADPVPTVFLRPLESGRRDHVYACTYDPHPVLNDGFRLLRDHRPFLFHPDAIDAVRISTAEGELKLARKHKDSPWRIIKPLELATEKDAVRRLVEGLYELTANKITDPAKAAASGDEAAGEKIEIAIHDAASGKDTLLSVDLPADPAARTAPATVSGRAAVFDLPLRTEAGKVALLELPLTVNDLRDKTLTRLHGPSLREIRIETGTGDPIILGRAPKGRWQLLGAGPSEDIDERAFLKLIEAVTRDKVAGFVTDAAADLKQWGLDHPELKLRFSSFDGEALELSINRGPNGEIFANRNGSPTVLQLDEATLARIATRRYQWKSPLLWSISGVDVVSIERQFAGQTPLTLRYSWIDETWKAERDGNDLTVDLNPNRANFLLSTLQRLQVLRWLSPRDSAASKALLEPRVRITLLVREVDALGDTRGYRPRTLLLTPVSDTPENQFYYGRLNSEPHFFMLDRQNFDNLTLELFEEE